VPTRPLSPRFAPLAVLFSCSPPACSLARFSSLQWLDNKHVVFGKVIDGMLTVRRIENVQTGINNKPKLPVLIAQCGEL
jgi:cyclophilin family peptidyl-prolyl cis-trans isomerase